MSKKPSLTFVFVPALCATFIVLLLALLRPVHVSDQSLGLVVGVFLGLAIVSIRVSLGQQPSELK